MTNQSRTPTAAERERREQASAGSHGGVEVLDADRPHTAGAPNITHQSTTDPYRAAPSPLADPTVDVVETPATRQSTVEATRGRSTWGTVLAAIVIIVLIILLISWLF